MRYLPVALLISQLISPVAFAADLYMVTSNESCRLKKNIGGQWVDANKSELEGLSFSIRQFPNTQLFAVRMNGVWYGGPKNCFDLAPTDSNSTPSTASQAPVESKREKPRVTERSSSSGATGYGDSEFNPKSIFFELDGLYTRARGADFQAGEVDGLTKAAAPAFMGFGFKLNYFLKSNVEFWGGLNYQSSTQKISTTLDEGSVKYTLIEPEAGLHFYFGQNKFKPYIGLEAGYALMGADLTLGDTTVKFGGSALSFGLMAGGVYYLSEGFGIVGELGYRVMSFSKFEVLASNLPGYDAGDIESTSVNPVTLLLGLRLGF